MRQFPATAMTRDPGAIKEAARKGPVAITEHNKPKFVMMSYERYERYIGLASDPRRSFSTDDMPEDLRELALAALDQPYDP